MTFGDFSELIPKPMQMSAISDSLAESYTLSVSQPSKATPYTLRAYQIATALPQANKALSASLGLARLFLLMQQREHSLVTRFNRWVLLATVAQFKSKVQNASQMVDKMSKFSRRFISFNSLEQILKRNKLKKLSRSLRLWSTHSLHQSEPVENNNDDPDLVIGL